jgi:hypothetical protein
MVSYLLRAAKRRQRIKVLLIILWFVSKAREGIHIVDSPQRNPKGCQKVAGGRSPRETTGKVISHDRTPKGCETSGQRKKILYSEGSGTPPGCDPTNLAFPVVSADSDHRLLSLQPFGLLR